MIGYCMQKRRRATQSGGSSSLCNWLCLCLDILFDGEFASVISAFGTYVMHHDLGTTVAACGQLRSLKAVMRSSFSRSRL